MRGNWTLIPLGMSPGLYIEPLPNPMKKIAPLLLISICLSCVDDNVQASLIYGDWKLMQAQLVNGHISYSAANIIYTFGKDGTLTVVGGANAGYTTGKYPFTLSADPDDPKAVYITIQGTRWRFGRTDIVMTLAQADVAGTNLVFWAN